jgi:hypothetical protein
MIGGELESNWVSFIYGWLTHIRQNYTINNDIGFITFVGKDYYGHITYTRTRRIYLNSSRLYIKTLI